MTTGRINQVAALKTAPLARRVPRPPGRACFDLVWNSLAPESANTATRPARAAAVPRRRARDPGLYAFTVAHSWVSPGLTANDPKGPGAARSEARHIRLSADCPVARAAGRRAFCNAPNSRSHRPLCVFIRLRIAHSHKPALFAHRGPKPAGAVAQRIASLRLR